MKIDIAGFDDIEVISTSTNMGTLVYIEDLRTVGARMGSERVNTIAQFSFADKEIAISFAALLVKRATDNRGEDGDAAAKGFKRFFEISGTAYRDCMSVGIGIKTVMTDVITGFTYDVPSVIREIVGESK